jgi:hypothetical protein
MTLVNCALFRDFEFTNPTTGVKSLVRGVCYNVQQHFQRYGISSRVLTLDNASKRVKGRRDFLCPDGQCTQYNSDLNKAQNRRNIKTSCDEFPFASSEEGGEYLNLIGLAGQRECVPVWQQTLQGNCNSKYKPQLKMNTESNIFCRDYDQRRQIGH